MRDNLYNFAAKGRGAPREGHAPGRCGRRMGVSHGSSYLRYECRRAQVDYAPPRCQAFPVVHLVRAVGELFLKAVQPAAVETSLTALAVLKRERQALDRQWRLRLERLEAEYAVVRRTDLLQLGEVEARAVRRMADDLRRSGARTPRPTPTASACCG